MSVCLSEKCTEKEIWNIAETYLDPNRKLDEVVVGRADLMASYYFNIKLDFKIDGEPFVQHANVINWPKEKEGAALSLRQQLARDADKIMKP